MNELKGRQLKFTEQEALYSDSILVLVSASSIILDYPIYLSALNVLWVYLGKVKKYHHSSLTPMESLKTATNG